MFEEGALGERVAFAEPGDAFRGTLWFSGARNIKDMVKVYAGEGYVVGFWMCFFCFGFLLGWFGL